MAKKISQFSAARNSPLPSGLAQDILIFFGVYLEWKCFEKQLEHFEKKIEKFEKKMEEFEKTMEEFEKTMGRIWENNGEHFGNKWNILRKKWHFEKKVEHFEKFWEKFIFFGIPPFTLVFALSFATWRFWEKNGTFWEILRKKWNILRKIRVQPEPLGGGPLRKTLPI